MLTQIIPQIFSYAFVFLLGLILGALGEMYWDRRSGKPKTQPDEAPLLARIEIPQINVDLPASVPQAAAAPAPTVLDRPVVMAVPNPTPAKPTKEEVKKPHKTLSIVEEVDEILQELQKFSQNSQSNISLMDDGKHGVTVKVGNQTYPGIDAVTDPEAQILLKKAVTEWERRSTRK